MKAPFYKVYLEGKTKKDITEKIEKFTYEDAIEEDSLLQITVRSEFARDMVDDSEFQTGKYVSFVFGFMEGQVSPVHIARITDITTKYRDRITLVIKCLDEGTNVKKVSSDKIWDDKTSIQIADEIAKKYSLTLVSITPTTKVWKDLPQGNRTDLSFLQYLAKREEGGNYICYIRNDKLYFVERAISRKSAITFTYGDGETIVSFEPSIKETKEDGTGQDTQINTLDLLNAGSATDVSKTSVTPASQKATGTTGENKAEYGPIGTFNRANFSADGFPLAPTTFTPSKKIVDATKDKKEAENLANSTKKKKTLKTLVAKLVTEGHPLLEPNNILTMANVAKRHAGNWFIIKITHDVSQGGYTSTFELNKNGGKAKGVKATDANTTQGEKRAETKKKLVIRDTNGNVIGETETATGKTMRGVGGTW